MNLVGLKKGDKVVFTDESPRNKDNDGVFTVEVVTDKSVMIKGLLYAKEYIRPANDAEVKANRRLDH